VHLTAGDRKSQNGEESVKYRYEWTALLCVALLMGCSRPVSTTRYYLLEYSPIAKNKSLMLEKPIDKQVQVMNFKIIRSYDSSHIIARFASHQINFYHYSLWAVRPQIAIADLLVQHINTYQLFKDCQREYLDDNPDFEISGEIQQVEKYESQEYTAAHLKMRFDLYDYESKDRRVTYSFDREIPIPTGDMTIFAKVLSDISQEEAEKFLVKVVEWFQKQEADSTQVPG